MNGLELTDIFCRINDFCKYFEPQWEKQLLTVGRKNRNRKSRLSLSEILTILMGFHISHFRNFKHY